jgi:hypothetical protein
MVQCFTNIICWRPRVRVASGVPESRQAHLLSDPNRGGAVVKSGKAAGSHFGTGQPLRPVGQRLAIDPLDHGVVCCYPSRKFGEFLGDHRIDSSHGGVARPVQRSNTARCSGGIGRANSADRNANQACHVS